MSKALLGRPYRKWSLRAMLACIALLVAAASATIPTQAGFTQQGNKLVGDDVVGAARQGASVALSTDGNTAIVGGWAENGNTGAAWVYVRIDGVWLQQGNKLIGTGAMGAARQGFSVALSADGNTAIIGGFGDNSFVGAAWVFTRDGNGVWAQQGNKLVGSDVVGAAGANQGHSVALSGDGNTAIVGGNADNNFIGAAWIFTRDSNGVWTQDGDKLVGSGAVGNANQGWSVAVAADTNTAIIGGYTDNSDVGAAWVFIRDKFGAWVQQGSKLVGSDVVGAAEQGYSVALSGDGNTAMVGGRNDNTEVGAAWVFTRSKGGWTQQGTKLVGGGAVGHAQQGRSVALSGDGNTAMVVGQSDNSGTGATWVFARNIKAVWSQQGNKLVAVGSTSHSSVALSADSNTAMVGGPSDNSLAGAAWVFARPGITGISPNAGTVTGGTSVTIIGENFLNVTGVLFGGVAATDVTTVDTNTIFATTPPHAAGAVNVVVTTVTGNNKLGRGYTYERIPTFIFLTSSINPSTAGQNVTFTAFVSGGGLPASGQVTFKDGTQTLGTVNLQNGKATFSTTALTAGSHTIVALFRRNGMFAASKAKLRQRVKN